ncbi:MAG: C1 family peptidase [PVC group bacterium]
MNSVLKPGLTMKLITILTSLLAAALSVRPAAGQDILPFAPDDTLEEIRYKINHNGYSFEVADNWVFSMSPEEKAQFFSRRFPDRPAARTVSLKFSPLLKQLGKQLPLNFDWRNVGGYSYIGGIRNQGGCGSCYSFGANAAAEGTYNWANGLYDGNCIDFSESYIIWCLGRLPAYSSHFFGCGGADWDYAELDALCLEGVGTESDFPYTTTDPGSCTHWGDQTYVFQSWHRIDCLDVEAIKTAIMTYGPVDAAVYVQGAFQSYSGGVYEDSYTSCPPDPGIGPECYHAYTNHAIALIGWDDAPPEGGGGVWILRNSWGTSWGESGYMRIRYTSARVACEVCYLVYQPPATPTPTPVGFHTPTPTPTITPTPEGYKTPTPTPSPSPTSTAVPREIPFTEDFEEAWDGGAPAGWTKEYIMGTNDWTQAAGGYNGHPASAHGGSYNARFFYDDWADIVTRLISPRLEFGPRIYNTRLTFWLAMEEWEGDQDELSVYYRTSAGGEWTLLTHYDTSLPSWVERSIDLPEPGNDYYICFECDANYGYGVCIDDLLITGNAAYPTPTPVAPPPATATPTPTPFAPPPATSTPTPTPFAPPPATSTPTPLAPTPAAATPTPTPFAPPPATSTPTPTPFAPPPATSTPTPTPFAPPPATATPTPNQSATTPTPQPSATPSPIINLLLNPSFELDPALVNWTKVGTSEMIYRGIGGCHGTYYCVFQDPTTQYSDRGIRSEAVSIAAGNYYDFNGWFYLLNEGGIVDNTQFQFLIEWRDIAQAILSTSGISDWNLSSFDVWEEKSYPGIQAPAGSAYVTLYLAVKETLNNNNNAFIDYFCINPGGAPPSPTPQISTTPPLPTPSPTPSTSCNYRVSGTVLDRDTSAAIPNADVWLEFSDHETTPAQTSGPDGSYSIFTYQPHSPGTVLARAVHPDYLPGNTATQWACNTEIEGIEIELERASVVTPTPVATPTCGPPLGQPGFLLESGDYDGDGTADIGIFRRGGGLWAIRGVTRAYFGGAGDVPVSGDYDGDGTADISIFRPTQGLWALRGISRIYYGIPGDYPAPADYDGNRTADVCVFRDAIGLWAVRGVTRAYFGVTGDRPVPGDYAGGGTDAIGIFRPSSGTWAVRGVTRVYFGGFDDWPVPGDYNGNGNFEVAIFRPWSSGLWAVRGVTRFYYGRCTDYPLRAGFDGTGTDSPGVFRQDVGLWAVRGLTRAYFGGSGDLPVTR